MRQVFPPAPSQISSDYADLNYDQPSVNSRLQRHAVRLRGVQREGSGGPGNLRLALVAVLLPEFAESLFRRDAP